MKEQDSPKNNEKNYFENKNENKNLKSISSLICPFCNMNEPIILEIKKDFTKNSFLIKLICKCLNEPKEITLNDLTKITEKQFKKNCYKHPEKEGIVYCEDCQKYLCEICKGYHKDFVSNHKTVSSNLMKNFENCEIHSDKKLSFYCENCDINLCSECQKINHNSHNVITLKDYWKKIFNKLKFHSVQELSEKLNIEKRNFDNIIIHSLEKISYLCNKFEKLRGLIFDFYNLSIENNKIISNIIISSFSEFFENKDNPNFNNIHNCECLMPVNLISYDECNELGRIFNGFSNLFNALTFYQSSIIKKDLINVKEINDINYKVKNNNNNIKEGNTETSIYNFNTVENNSTQSHSIKKENDKINNTFLNRKTKLEHSPEKNKKNKSKHVFKIPLNEEIKKINENIINNNILKNINKTIIDNSTTNNIIFPLKVGENPVKLSTSAKLSQNGQKDIFTFDAVICRKYIDSHSNDFLETFSNNSLNQEGYDLIHPKKVEDNKIIKNNNKKKEESDNNTTTINNTNNIGSNEQIIEGINNKNEDDPNFFNNIFYNNNTNSLGDNTLPLNSSIIKSDIGITENSLNIEK